MYDEGLSVLALRMKKPIQISRVLLISFSVLAGLLWTASGWFGWDAIPQNHDWKIITPPLQARLRDSTVAAAYLNGIAAGFSALAAFVAAYREWR